MKVSKARLFVENMLIYGLGGIISKVIPLVMLPIITRMMPDTTYFGLSDLSNTIISFASAIAIMGMYDAMFRLFFEKEDELYKKTICSTALIFTICTSVIVFIILLIFKENISCWVFRDKDFVILVYLCAIAVLVGATNSIISAPTRMQNKRGIFLITNTISPIISYSVSIPLLLNGYYVIALPLASIVSGIIMESCFFVINRKWFKVKLFNKNLLKELLIIAVPTMPVFLIYWVFDSCDKLMIASILGVAAEGVYSIGAKLGHLSQLVYLAFSGGWQYVAFSTMNDDNQVESNSKILEYLGNISFVSTLFICAFSFTIYNLFFEGDYVLGYTVAPYLFLAPLLQMLFQIGANQLLIIKKTWPIPVILSSGALVNIGINFLLIPRIGIEGAAIATLVGYIFVNIVCFIVLTRMKLLIISGKFMFTAGVTFIYIFVWRVLFKDDFAVGLIIAIIVTLFFVVVYYKDIMILVKKILTRR